MFKFKPQKKEETIMGDISLDDSLANINKKVEEKRDIDNVRTRTDEKGFPLPRCKNGLDSVVGGCLTEEQEMSILDATKYSSMTISESVMNFVSVVGVVGLNNMMDLLSSTLLNIENLNKVNKEEIKARLDSKLNVLKEVYNDPEGRELIDKVGKSLGDVINRGAESASGPILDAMTNITSKTMDSASKLNQSATKFAVNTIRAIPGIGQAYSILDNSLQVGKGLSTVAAAVAANAGQIAMVGDKLVKTVESINPNIQEFGDNVRKLKAIGDRIETGTVNTISGAIKKTGDDVSSTIKSVTPGYRKTGGGLKKRRKSRKLNKKRSYKVRKLRK
tara:strand:+ start:7305 stop:8303 length:999 start_codon:yes stop_codon:yes gene_type:complete